MMRRFIVMIALIFLVMPLAFTAQAATVNPNLPIQRASYWGGKNTDAVNAVDMLPDSTFVVAGAAPTFSLSITVNKPLGASGDGLLVRYNAAGSAPMRAARFPSAILDAETNSGGQVVVCGGFGVVVLTADLNVPLWSNTTSAVDRCGLSDDGTVATLGGGLIRVFDAAGGNLGNWSPGGTVKDVAVGGGASARVFEVGYTQVSSNLQVAYVRGRTPAGVTQWTGWNFTESAVTGQNLGADSRAERVSFGLDGNVYVSAYTDGGNSIFSRNPQDVTSTLSSGVLIKTDAYNDPFNISGAKALGWYGRFDPATGGLLKAQWLLTRLDDGKGNSVGIRAIEADEAGQVFISGEAYYALDGRTTRKVGGVKVGNYSGGEPFFLHISADFTQRLYWTTFAAPNKTAGGSPASAIGVRKGHWVMGVTLKLEGGQRLITLNPPQSAPAGGTHDGYWVKHAYNVTPPMQPVLVSPTSDVTVNTSVPVFQWTGDPANTDSFQITLKKRNGDVIKKVKIPAYSACVGTACQTTLPNVSLPNRNGYTWTVRAINTGSKSTSLIGTFNVTAP